MRVLADENFPRPIVARGFDVLWARTDFPQTTDVALLDRAEAEGRILVTLDKDFLQIASQRRRPLERAGVAVFRIHPATSENLARLVRTFADTAIEWVGHIGTIRADGIHIVKPSRQ